MMKQRHNYSSNSSNSNNNMKQPLVSDDKNRFPKTNNNNKRQRRRSLIFGPLVGGLVFVFLVGLLLLLLLLVVQQQPSEMNRTLLVRTAITNQTTTKATIPSQATNLVVTPLNDNDKTYYSIRINTWNRTEALRYSLQHHLTCPNVAQIVVVWCTAQGLPPHWLQTYPDERVVLEYHQTNSLNERFVILVDPKTRGILSIDDDVLRPCIALSHAFHIWKRHPEYQVGFDARTHVVDNNSNQWKYGYMSTTEHTNAYSMTLTRYSFQHVDYLYSYTNSMPLSIRDTVAQNFNCEDVAMSFWISKHTNSVPLLADYWASKSMIKLFTEHKISASSSHKALRDDCVNDFADLLQLKQDKQFQPAKLFHGTYFDYGRPRPNDIDMEDEDPTVQRWKQAKDGAMLLKELSELRKEASFDVYAAGLLEGSPPWKKRFASR